MEKAVLNNTVREIVIRYRTWGNRQETFQKEIRIAVLAECTTSYEHLKFQRVCFVTGPLKGEDGGSLNAKNLDVDACPIFLGLEFDQILFSYLCKFLSRFFGLHKISTILGVWKFPATFFGVPIFISHTSVEWRTHSNEKHKIIVAFHICQTLTKKISLFNSTLFLKET